MGTLEIALLARSTACRWFVGRVAKYSLGCHNTQSAADPSWHCKTVRKLWFLEAEQKPLVHIVTATSNDSNKNRNRARTMGKVDCFQRVDCRIFMAVALVWRCWSRGRTIPCFYNTYRLNLVRSLNVIFALTILGALCFCSAIFRHAQSDVIATYNLRCPNKY